MSFFFGTHQTGFHFSGIPQHGLLNYSTSTFHQFNLPLDFVGNGPFYISERVHILKFCPRTKLFLAPWPDRDVCITSQAALFHIPITYFKILDNLTNFSQVGVRFLGSPQIRFRYNLNQRSTCSVQVDKCMKRILIVNRFTRILFHMNPGDTDPFFILSNLNIDRSEEHTSELQSRGHLVCRLLLEKKKQTIPDVTSHRLPP